MINWIAVDWGTSNLRIWAIGPDNKIIDQKYSSDGMSGLEPGDFEPTLLSHIDNWLSDQAMPIIACGMVGARQGWQEAPYDTVPSRPAAKWIKAGVQDWRLHLHIISGLAQSDPADVIRGEETQIAGFLHQNPDYKGVLCLPGTHTKWVEIENGQVIKFRTAMTGELFDILSRQSVLRHSNGVWSDELFLEAIHDTYQKPENMAMELFGIRAQHLLKGQNNGMARLSGLLIGAELKSTQYKWHNKTITIIGEGELARLYTLALQQQAVQVQSMHADTLTLEGLRRVYSEVIESCAT